MMVLQNYAAPMSDGQQAQTWQPVELPATRFDLEWHVYASRDGGLRCRMIYNTALFGSETVERVGQHLQMLLRDMASCPQARLSELDLADPAERAMIERWNDTATPVDPDATLVSLVAEQIRRTPEAIAVSDESRAWTYAELDRAADVIAAYLHGEGIGPESVVGVHARRSVWLMAALLGVLRSGAAYLPLDPDYPPERVAYMLADAGAAIVLREDEPVGAAGGHPPAVDIQPHHCAYLIYTSGSTGRPKGVVNEHRGIVNRLMWMQSAYRLTPDDVVLQKTPAAFDVSVWEFFWPLIVGARIVFARPGGHRDPAYLRELIAAQRVTTVHFVPSMLAAFLADAPAGESCASLRRIVCSGEELPVDLARRTLEAVPQASLYNLYGPTEAAVDVTAFTCTVESLAGRARVPIGAPISNVTIDILDGVGRAAPIGVPGDIFIGGVQVARGYHHRPELTAQRFVLGPDGQRRYATGDRGRWLADGTIEFLGRIDDQIKLRGLRIELGEIEAALAARPGVEGAAAAVKEFAPGDRRLVGYVVGDADRTALREELGRTLPDYMVPSVFVTLGALPLSPNGKLDRKALPLPELDRSAEAFVAPRNDPERAIAVIWSEVLGVDTIGVHDDFFGLGGHSLLATQVVARLRQLTEGTGTRIGVMDLFQHPTVAGSPGSSMPHPTARGTSSTS
jgi:amino acid adenylation domain-containing protein